MCQKAKNYSTTVADMFEGHRSWAEQHTLAKFGTILSPKTKISIIDYDALDFKKSPQLIGMLRKGEGRKYFFTKRMPANACRRES